ncbi:FAD-binding oxidoreductase [Actinomycetaceae bacterium L2_0104]
MLTNEHIEDLKGLLGADLISTDKEELFTLSQDSSFRSQKLSQAHESWGLAEVLVTPRDESDIVATMKWATANKVPVVVRGPGSGVSGAGIPQAGGILIDVRHFNRVLDFNEVSGHVKVEGSAMLQDLDDYLRERGFTLGHYPQSFSLAGVAGSISLRGSGTFSSLYGNVEDIVAELRVVLPTGEIYESHYSPRSATGPDLRQLFIGAEGTFGVLTEVTLKVYKTPEARIFQSYAFKSFKDALDTVQQTLWLGINPAVARIYDPVEGSAKHAQFTTESDDEWLMVLLYEGSEEVVAAQEARVNQIALGNGARSLGPEPAITWEEKRFDVSWFTDQVDNPGGLAESVEVAATWDKIQGVWEAMREAALVQMDTVMGHVSHVYRDGASLYVIASGSKNDDDEALVSYTDHWKRLSEAAMKAGGVICHHHSVGLERGPWLRESIGTNAGPILDAIKDDLDPAGIMNPGKLGFKIPEGLV